MENLKRHKLWLTAGIPGLGKSTWVQNHKKFFSGSTEVVSRDAIRFSILKEGEDYFAHEDSVWTEYVNKTLRSLKYNENTILDATHLSEGSRAKILRALGKSLKDTEVNIIFFKGSLDTALKRNDMRKGLAFVPKGTIRRMYFQATEPSYSEGFDKIYIINVDKNDEIIEKVGN